MALVAYLAGERPEARTRERISYVLWGAFPERQASQNLRAALKRVRAILGPNAIFSEGRSITLCPETVQCDVVEFERLLEDNSHESMKEAADLYAGWFLEGLEIAEPGWEDWVRERRNALHGKVVQAHVKIAERARAAEDYESCLRHSERAAELEPFREDAHRLMLIALTELGRKSEALSRNQHFMDHLERELGATPATETTLLVNQLQGTSPVVYSALARKPRIAVLPLADLTEDTPQTRITEGIVEDIVTELARFRDLAVIDPASSFSAAEKGEELRAMSEKLAVAYFVQGSFRSYGQRFRLNVSLVDPRTGTRIWSERYDRDVEGFWDVLDQLVRTVAGEVIGWLERRGRENASRRPTSSMDAYEKVIAGRRQFLRMLPETNCEARILFEEAWYLDPNYAGAVAWLSETHLGDWAGGWTANPRVSLESGAELAHRALEIDGSDSRTHTAMARAAVWLGDPETARKHFEKALDLNPSDAWAMASAARFQALNGDAEKSLATLADTVRVNPLGNYDYQLGIAHFSARNYATATEHLGAVTQPIDLVHAFHAASLFHECKMQEAASAASKLKRAYRQRCIKVGIDPNSDPEVFLADRFPYRDRNDLHHFLGAVSGALHEN